MYIRQLNHNDATTPALLITTHGLEELTNLQNTMFNNSLQWVGLTVRQNTGGRGAGWDQILRAWYPQAFVGKTAKFK